MSKKTKVLCSLILSPTRYGYECCVCNRFIACHTDMREVCGLLLFECGVPSEYDAQQQKLKISGRFSVYPVNRSNELIGQEDGVWDKFYLEGQL